MSLCRALEERTHQLHSPLGHRVIAVETVLEPAYTQHSGSISLPPQLAGLGGADAKGASGQEGAGVAAPG